MLEKNKKIFVDAHFHYSQCNKSKIPPENWKGCSCALDENEFELQQNKQNIFTSFGIHPFECIEIAKNKSLFERKISFLQNKLTENKIHAIGEIGFDFFTDEYKKFSKLQEEMFLQQIELAQIYKMPIVIHARKLDEKLFEFSNRLKKIPAVLFHSFMGTSNKAQSLIGRGINAYFSFGKQIMNNNKKTIDCVKNLPIQNLLLETDAPYQKLKNQTETFPSEIIDVYKAAFSLRFNFSFNERPDLFQEFCIQLNKNFDNLYQ